MIRLRLEGRQNIIRLKSLNPKAQEGPRVASEPSSNELKRGYVVVAGPPAYGFVTQRNGGLNFQ